MNEKLGASLVPDVTPDFGAGMKGKKTVDSLKAAVDDLLAAAKIDATEWYELIHANKAIYADLVAADMNFLFPDYNQLVLKESDSFRAVLKSRLMEHKETVEAKAKAAAEKAAAEAKPTPAPAEKAEATEQSSAANEPATQTVTRVFSRGKTPPKDLMLQAVADAFSCDNAMAAVFICETADAIRGTTNGGGRLGKIAKAMGDRIVDAKSKEDLLAVGKDIQEAKSSSNIDDIDDAWLQAQYRRKQAELRP